MRMRTVLILMATHVFVAIVGFAAGIYTLPILSAPPAPQASELATKSQNAQYTAEFTRDLVDSDALHWGQGVVSLGPDFITFMGELAPGPEYKLYLSPEFVETEANFLRLKHNMVRIGDVKTFDNFVVAVDETIDLSAYTSVIVWCEAFDEFITAAKYN